MQKASGAPSQVLLSKFSGLPHQVHQSGEHGDVSRLETHLLDLRQQKESSGAALQALRFLTGS